MVLKDSEDNLGTVAVTLLLVFIVRVVIRIVCGSRNQDQGDRQLHYIRRRASRLFGLLFYC